MSTETSQLPGYGRFIWILLMQPVLLHDEMKALGIDLRELVWKAWRRPGDDQALRRRIIEMFIIVLFAFMPVTTFMLARLLNWSGISIDYLDVAKGLALGLALGLAFGLQLGLIGGLIGGLAFGLAFGLVFGLTFGLDGGLVGALFGGLSTGLPFSFAFGLAFGLAFGQAKDLAFGFAYGMIGGLAFGLAEGLGGILSGGLAEGLFEGLIGGISFTLSWGIGYTRAPIYILEIVFQWFAQQSPRHSPILYHDYSFFPHLFLQKTIVATGPQDTDLTRRLLDACARAPGQRKIGRRALFHLQALELKTLMKQKALESCKNLQGQWLPGLSSDEPLLPFSDIAHYLHAAELAKTDRNRQQNLEKARTQLNSLRNQLRQDNTFRSRILLQETLPVWEQTTDQLLKDAQTQAAQSLPNPFLAGNPLDPELGGEVFRGRDPLVQTLEEVLGDDQRSCSLALLGPRRSGKTSLLKMLPKKLPDAVCIFFDLQANPQDQPETFFQALASEAQMQAVRHFRVKLPPLPEGSPFQAATQWFEQLDNLPGNQRVLLCIDEFERLETTFPGSRQELEKLMGLLRATIQHRKKVKLLISGATTFDEMSDLWDDHFINIRELRMTWLNEAETVDLLHNPFPEFPSTAIPKPLAQTVYRLTGGQPFLAQFCGQELVNLLNRESRTRATEQDLERVISERLFVDHGAYFRQVMKSLSPQAREALQELAGEKTPEWTTAIEKELRKRLLLDDRNQLVIPLIGRWMVEGD